MRSLFLRLALALPAQAADVLVSPTEFESLVTGQTLFVCGGVSVG